MVFLYETSIEQKVYLRGKCASDLECSPVGSIVHIVLNKTKNSAVQMKQDNRRQGRALGVVGRAQEKGGYRARESIDQSTGRMVASVCGDSTYV